MNKNTVYEKLINLLDAHNASYRLIDHKEEGRTEIVSGYRGNDVSSAAKCMILKVNLGKKEVKYVLGVIEGDAKINFNAIKDLTGGSYASFAPTEETEKLAGSVVGTVLPFSFSKELELIVDPALLKHDEIFFNAARLDRSMALKKDDYVAIAKPRIELIAQEKEQRDQTDDASGLDHLRHSCAHLLAAAVMELWPTAKRTIGPAIENGFYYDFDFGDVKVSEEDFPVIEEKMKELVKSWKSFERKKVSLEEALKFYHGNEYKKELIEEFATEGKDLTLYESGAYSDLCRGGHCPHPNNDLKHFKLLSVAGAYWRGNEKNKMLTRIYGTCFPKAAELEAHLIMLEEAKKRDHRKLGADLGLFVFSDLVGRGLPLWTAKGATIRRTLERFIVDEEIKRGYSHVYTPDIANLSLYKTSGHYPYYKDTMYAPITIEGEEYMLRPMTCPHHFELFKSAPRSYKELPLRFAEVAKLYRFEKSGELTGLMRVRSFSLADAHIVAMKSQATDEINGVLDLIEFIAKTFGLAPGVNYRYRLSLGDRRDDKKYFKDDASWDHAESVLRNVLVARKAEFYEAPNEAAFYGPKIDVQMKNIAGKEDTAFTVQYDFVMPKRFKLEYITESGEKEEPIVIHRASIGAIERTVAFLIELYGGAFPLWLAPVQVALIPIAERHQEASRAIAASLQAKHIRVTVDDRGETMQSKIRDNTLQKVPYLGIIGDREAGGDSLSVRTRSGEDLKTMSLTEFTARLENEIEHKL